jgi:hypothetical protein
MFTSSEHVSSCGRRSPNTRPGSVLLGSSGCRLLLFGCPTGCCFCRLFNRGCFFRNFTAKKQDTYATVTRGFSVIGQQGIKKGALRISGQGIARYVPESGGLPSLTTFLMIIKLSMEPSAVYLFALADGRQSVDRFLYFVEGGANIAHK